MKNLKLSDISDHLCHPDPPAGGEGSSKLYDCADSSLSLRMTSNMELHR